MSFSTIQYPERKNLKYLERSLGKNCKESNYASIN